MYIYPKSTGPIRPDAASPSSNADATERSSDVRPIAPARRPFAMPPKNESTQHKLDRIRRPRVHLTYDVLDPARAARIRGRILNGAYDTLEVVDAVARRLLDSGDL